MVKKCQNSTEKCSLMDISAKLLCGSTSTFEDKLFASLHNALDVVQLQGKITVKKPIR
jgi:hypothetical protein